MSLGTRASKFTLLARVERKTAAAVGASLQALLKPYAPTAVHTITADNGKAFARHGQVAKALDAGFFFAQPYHSWPPGEHGMGGSMSTPTAWCGNIYPRPPTS